MGVFMKIALMILSCLLTVSATLATAQTKTMTFDLSAYKTPIKDFHGFLIIDGNFYEFEDESKLPASFLGCGVVNDNGGLEQAQKSPLTLTVTGERMGMYSLAKKDSASGVVTVQCIHSENGQVSPIDALVEIEKISNGAIKVN
jgi:hypothetical protein